MTELIDAPAVERDDIEFVPEQIELAHQAQAGDLLDRRAQRKAALRPIMWRLHFLGGFLAGPVVLALCVSGILFAWYPQIDDIRFGDVMHESADRVEVTLADQVGAAQAAHPDWGVYAVTPGHAGDNTMVTMDPPGGKPGFRGPGDAQYVYVDQATGQVTGTIDKEATSDSWLRSLHSSLRLGPNVEPLTELAGSWFLVTLLTGVYLWWPGVRRRGSMAFAARRKLRGRRRHKDWHNFIGVGLLVPMALLAITGLTWTQFAGDRVDTVKEQLSVPRNGADSTLPAFSAGHADVSNIDEVFATATSQDMVSPIQIVVPVDDGTGWQVTSQDNTFPLERDQITIDGNTATISSSFDYADEHWFNKLRTSAILFHQAQLFGLGLQIFMTLLTLAVAALVVLGYRMWWGRRPSTGFGAPTPIRTWIRTAPASILGAVVVLGLLMPVLGASLLVWLSLEAGRRWIRAARDPQAGASRSLGLGQRLMAAGFVAIGGAMVVRPALGGGIEEPTTLPRLAIWAWGWPLGVVFASVGLAGVWAAISGSRRSGVAAVNSAK